MAGKDKPSAADDVESGFVTSAEESENESAAEVVRWQGV